MHIIRYEIPSSILSATVRTFPSSLCLCKLLCRVIVVHPILCYIHRTSRLVWVGTWLLSIYFSFKIHENTKKADMILPCPPPKVTPNGRPRRGSGLPGAPRSPSGRKYQTAREDEKQACDRAEEQIATGISRLSTRSDERAHACVWVCVCGCVLLRESASSGWGT